ncbi:MAG: cystathionine gamma-synthase [Armatimonadetes bacterium]|nr:cystathionine gamma-synthase [Armatimonadota bacterium]
MSPAERRHHFETRAIHDGQPPDPATGAVIVPIYQTSTYAQEAPGRHRGYEYSRTGNPTRTALEVALASLEEGRFGLAFASGMAAIAAMMYLVSPGEHVIAPDDVYGGTYRLLVRVLERYGIQSSFVDMTRPDIVGAAMRPQTRMILIESPTNPYLKVLDIAALAEIARSRGAIVAVDNTFASPYAQRPLRLEADIVMHSTTKYLGGHSDVIGGALVVNREDLYQTLKFHQNAAGGTPGPFDCWLVLRGIKTLAVRMRQHAANAEAIARFLAAHPRVAQVFYPGLPDHPGHALAARQMSSFGGMVSFIVRGGQEAAARVASSTTLFFLAESLGGVESLVDHPATMTHASLAGSPLQVDAGLLRLSVGLEHPDDLIADLDQALARA